MYNTAYTSYIRKINYVCVCVCLFLCVCVSECVRVCVYKSAYTSNIRKINYLCVRNAVLHLSELSDQLDVTLESSKIVKLALIATTQSDAIK